MTNHPTPTKRIGAYDPATRQYPAYVAIDGEPEQCIGYAWSVGGADRLCDSFLYDYFSDNHTPEKAAAIAAAAEPNEYQAALAADDAWQAELERLFGRRAGDVRYTEEGRTGPTLAPLHAEFCRTCDAWHARMAKG